MKTKKMVLWGAVAGLALTALAADIELPKPKTAGGKPLLTALSERQSNREFAATPLSDEMMANLLWAANGINREGEAKRTAPTARNKQEIDLYLILEQGTYHYDAPKNKLELAVAEDLRHLAGRQDFARTAPFTILFVADYRKQDGMGDRMQRRQMASVDCGFIGQNVYLFCASEGLNTVFRAMVDARALAEKLKLDKEQEVLFAQSVGFPKK